MAVTYSKGILEQIKTSPIKDPLTIQGVREELYKHMGMWQQIDPRHKREYVVQTGTRGYQLFADTLRRSAILEVLKGMEDKFTPEEMVSIKKMVDSEDMENLEVASTIIDVKLKQTSDVSNIQSTQP